MKSDDDVFKAYLIVAGAMVALVVAGIVTYYTFNECTRVHPVWYCVAS